jgi:hypothetical protein
LIRPNALDHHDFAIIEDLYVLEVLTIPPLSIFLMYRYQKFQIRYIGLK